MRHKVAGRGFGRNCGHRKALLRNLVTSLFEKQRIETTVAKAKEVRGIAEKLVTLGIQGDQHSRRRVMSYVYTKKAVGDLFNEIAPRMKGRNGGYLRLMRTRVRPGDAAEMAVLEFVDFEEVHGEAAVEKPKVKKAKKTAEPAEEKPKAKVKKAKKTAEPAEEKPKAKAKAKAKKNAEPTEEKPKAKAKVKKSAEPAEEKPKVKAKAKKSGESAEEKPKARKAVKKTSDDK